MSDNAERTPAPPRAGPATSDEFKNAPLFLLVEHTLFAVNRHNFTDDSEFFQELYELPPPAGEPVEGSCADCPLVIEGVKEKDMTLLLRVMFPRYISDTDDVSCDEWLSILELLGLWRFNVGKAFVLKKLQQLTDPVTQILLHDAYELDPQVWLVPSVSLLAKRSSPLTEAEGNKLGVLHTVRIARIRESFIVRHRMKLNARGDYVDEVIPRQDHDFARTIKFVYKVDEA